MKALRAELAVELIGGVVSVRAPRPTLWAHWELWSTNGNRAAGTLPAPTLREHIMDCKVAEANPFTALFRSPFHI